MRQTHTALAGGVCKTWIKHGTALQVFNDHHLHAVLARKDRPLISVCNHGATLDDPILFGYLPWKTLLDVSSMRWSLGAKEICFTNPFTSWFFGAGQVLPIVRGTGVYQPSMNRAVDLLNDNRWVHIFSEGRVNQQREMLRFKWGIGRLVLDARTPPLVLPFYQRGMETMVPLGQHYPTPFTKVVMAFGEPIDFREHLPLLQSSSPSTYSHANDASSRSQPVHSFTDAIPGDPSLPSADMERRILVTRLVQDRVEHLKKFVDKVYYESE
ncbi:acyltransferase-domain-containing protein [Entophlyctis helioformis]|nr:acyltransferase-domain-containing protein [Entophlyctis helioformis]